MHKPLKSHLNIALKVLRYLKGSPGKGVHIVRCLKLSLETFLDADWAKCLVTRKSVMFLFVLKWAIASATSKTVWVLKCNRPIGSSMKRVLCYLRETTDLGLQLFRSTTSQLIAYSDADWAGCTATRRSTSEYCVFLGDNILTWSFKCQDTLSRFSAEAEYRWVANAVVDTSWIRNLLRELHTPLFTATLVYCDNVSAVYMSANPVQHQRTKHIEIDIHFVRDKVAVGHVRVLHVPSRFQYANIFTKRLPYPLFTDFRSSLSVRKSPAPTAGAY
ncbi:ribonuclease H-like domain-containing protein [Tanacetum coccineum]|uniref:Ribonuclease H-like domain-containing protein n=1 Tax=Tanacetum coccineum TaxID=301880 RepID=A0ABQ4ZTY0_9ASTR